MTDYAASVEALANKQVDMAWYGGFTFVPADMPAAQREKLTPAFLRLDRSTAEGKEILDLQHATRFIATKADNYQGIEQAARSTGLLKRRCAYLCY